MAASEHAGRVIGIYQRHATAYDQQRSRGLMETSWLEAFRACLPAEASVLDLGCGMGEPMAAYLARHGVRVTGVDASGPLIALARKRFPEQEWIVADMREVDLENRQFDGCLAWHSFFFLPHADQRAMFAFFAQSLRPGAPLLFTSGVTEGEIVGAFEGEPLYHASLDTAEYHRLLDASGFDVVSHVINDASCGNANIWLARRRA